MVEDTTTAGGVMRHKEEVGEGITEAGDGNCWTMPKIWDAQRQDKNTRGRTYQLAAMVVTFQKLAYE